MSQAQAATPNIPLRNWRSQHHLSRAELADKVNRSQAGIAGRLVCDDERIRRWETGEVRWPSPAYRRALREVTGLEPGQLGFAPHDQDGSDHPAGARIEPADAFRSEAALYDAMDLAGMVTASDLGQGALDALQEAAELLCRAYPSAPAAELRTRAMQRLRYVARMLQGRTTLRQHRELVVAAGWLSLLLGCLHYDLGQREQAEAARQAAYQAGMQAGHGEIIGWSYELAAWFALTEGRYQDVAAYARAGQQHAGLTSAMVQLVLQHARGQARLGERNEVRGSLNRGAKLLEQLPRPEHPENHFVFDHTKWIFYAATCYTWLGDDEPAEEHAREIITYHTRPDGTSDAPMRTANSHMDLAVIHARRRELDEAVHHGVTALSFDRKTESSLLSRAADLDHLLSERYPDERQADDFRERYHLARSALQARTQSSA
jgi:transcriptional regulator with XRE-family HTH domain